MRDILGPVSLDEPSVHDFIRRDVREGLKKIKAASFPKIMEVLR
jgi:hypothetical protein